MNANDRKSFSRRRFLECTLLGGGAAALFGDHVGSSLTRLANAQAVNPDAPDRYYIFAYFAGGWDVLLGLDPRDPRLFGDGNLRTTRIQPAYELLERPDADVVRLDDRNMTFGPYIGNLIDHADRLAVVRGMSMETLTHDVGRRRFLTGKAPSGLQARGTSAGTWLASHLGAQQPIPQLSLRVESYNTDQPNYASALRVSNVDDLLRALRPAAPVAPARLSRQVASTLAQQARCLRASDSPMWQAAEGSRLKAREMASQGLADAFDFGASTPLMEALRDHYGIDPRRLDSTQANAALAVQAIVAGISRVVSIPVALRLDHHFDDWATDHGPIQQSGFDLIARMADMLASLPYGNRGESWLDRTTIIGFSEFSRTPLLNTRGGRDHHLGNSCLLLGGGVRGGQVIGASSDVGMNPQPVDLRTGRVDPGGEVIRPEHILSTLFDEVGIDADAADLRVPACRTDPLDGCPGQRMTIPSLMRG